MCKERIPKDATVRMAIDPYSHKQVDKANAVIAVTGNNGEVSYFENKENYAKYVKKQ
jgi:YHS domain-containing protein